jgi:hypothetical protein
LGGVKDNAQLQFLGCKSWGFGIVQVRYKLLHDTGVSLHDQPLEFAQRVEGAKIGPYEYCIHLASIIICCNSLADLQEFVIDLEVTRCSHGT